jgi:phosphoribosylglycinamide formyltransferase 1
VKNIVVLISGRGSNLEAIVHADLPARVAAVISNRANAPGLSLAARSGLPTAVVDDHRFHSREAFDDSLANTIDRYAPELVVLAGFMRILSDDFVRRYEGRLVNIHPSLLPAFPGLHTHRRALEEGVKVHGCTAHFVTAQLDRGPIIIQGAVPVHPGDTEQTLAARVLRQEHRIYPLALRWIIEGRLVIANGIVRVNDASASQTLFSEE